MSQKFTIQPHSTIDKSFDIYGPQDLLLMVDFDDVDHETVEKLTKRMVDILNEHWEAIHEDK